MMKIGENRYGEDVEISYSKIYSCATVTLELSPPTFIGMHFVFVDAHLIPTIVEDATRLLRGRKIKNLYLAFVPFSWRNNMKALDRLKTSFPDVGAYLVNELNGDGNKLCFKFEREAAVITDKSQNITDEFGEWW